MLAEKNDGLPEDRRCLAAGVAALESEDYTQAFQTLLPQAEAGNAEAQANVGLLYFLGFGVNQNLEEAAHWLKKAAANG